MRRASKQASKQTGRQAGKQAGSAHLKDTRTGVVCQCDGVADKENGCGRVWKGGWHGRTRVCRKDNVRHANETMSGQEDKRTRG